MDFLECIVESGRDSVPEVKERIFLHANVDKHCLEPGFDIFHAALEDASDQVEISLAFNLVFLKNAILEQGHPALEFLGIDYNGVAFPGIDTANSEGPSDFFQHDWKVGFRC